MTNKFKIDNKGFNLMSKWINQIDNKDSRDSKDFNNRVKEMVILFWINLNNLNNHNSNNRDQYSKIHKIFKITKISKIKVEFNNLSPIWMIKWVNLWWIVTDHKGLVCKECINKDFNNSLDSNNRDFNNNKVFNNNNSNKIIHLIKDKDRVSNSKIHFNKKIKCIIRR